MKYTIFSLVLMLLATSISAQTPSLPSLDIDNPSKEESSLDPLLDTAPSQPAGNAAPVVPVTETAQQPTEAKILDKAIDEVFKEPDVAPAEAPKQATIQIDSDNPEEAKSIKTEAPTVTPEADQILTTPTETAAPTIAPEAPTADATAPVTSTQEKASEAPAVAAPTTTETKSEEKPVEAKLEEPKQEAKEEKAVQKKKIAKALPKKKRISLPKQTPKSLREDYMENNFDNGMMPNQNSPYTIPAQQLNGFPPNTKPLNDINFQPAVTPTPIQQPIFQQQPKPMPKSLGLSSNEIDNFDSNELDVIKDFPSKKKILEVKENISIDRGNFSNPFGGASEELVQTADTQEITKKDDSAEIINGEVPVVDFSDSAAPIEATNNRSTSTKSENFYMEDSGLEVEVKDAPANSLSDMQNAYEALQVGQYESAIKYYNNVLATNPENKKALFGVATAYHMSKDIEKAKDTYLKIISIDPNYWPAVNNYIILVTDENPEKSIPRLEQLYAKNPTFAAIPAQLGNLYYKKGDIQNSVNYYTNAIKTDPENVEYRYNLAVILEKTSRTKDAADLYRSLLEDASRGKQLPENPNSIKDRYDQLISQSKS